MSAATKCPHGRSYKRWGDDEEFDMWVQYTTTFCPDCGERLTPYETGVLS